MELRNLKLSWDCVSNGGKAILKSITPTHPFRDGKRIDDEIIGRTVTVVLPAAGYDTLAVKVADTVDALSPALAKATPENPIFVEFMDFQGGVYAMRGNDGQIRVGVSARASSVRIVRKVDDFNFDDDDEIVV